MLFQRQPALLKYALILVLVAIAGCNRTTSPPAPVVTQPAGGSASNGEPLEVVRAQTDALNREDLEAMLATIDPESPAYDRTKEMTGESFRLFELRYTNEKLTLESVSTDEARVRATQLTERISGPAFRNNRIEAVHVLKKRNGVWKISTTELIDIKYLDQ
jgi:ketosteroid isomerase-like protein